MRSVLACTIGFSLLFAEIIGASDAGSKVFIKEVGIFLVLPKEYSLERNKEANRRGSFVSYDFKTKYNPNVPTLLEVQFFSRKSIQLFEDECAKCEDCGGESFCVTGEYPTTAEYDRQEQALKNPRSSKTNYHWKRFGNRNFIVSDHKSIGETGYYREYRTFINDIMVAVWIDWENESQAKAADGLFANLKILEE